MERLDKYLSNKLSLTRNKVEMLIDNGLILVNNLKQKPSYKIKEDDNIQYDIEKINNFLEEKPLEPWDFRINIIYEDDDVIVINKPKELLCHPTKFERNHTLSNALIYHTKGKLSDIGGIDRLGIVHRLDKNTAGLMVAAKNNFAHKNLANQIKTKEAKRKYLAIAIGRFDEKQGVIDKPLVHYIKDDVKMKVAQQGLEAITIYKVIEEYNNASLVELELKTGRTHQIRAHLSYINHPIWGDNLYGSKGMMKAEHKKIKTTEQLLQSYYLSFNHPKTNEFMEFELKESDFSKDFIKVLNFLRSSL